MAIMIASINEGNKVADKKRKMMIMTEAFL